MSNTRGSWLAVLETRTHNAASRCRKSLMELFAGQPTRRRSDWRPWEVELLEVRQLLTSKFGSAPQAIYDSPALLYSPAEVLVTLSAASVGEQNAGGKGGSGTPSTNYSYSVVGNAADAAVNAISSGLALVGGGTDVDEVFRWMGTKANGGDFVVLRATGTNAYNSYIDRLVPALDSVATLVISTLAGANDPFVAQKIREAEAIFIAGGDQADYINLWKNTAVETAIYDAIARLAPIGGTSAGLAVLSDYDFSARNGTITSAEALANPYDSRVTLDGGFLSEGDFIAERGSSQSVLRYLDYLITDSHFQQRDRMGRLVTFMARMDADGLVPDAAPRGIGINEQTALLVEANGTARVVGNAYSGKLSVDNQRRAVYLLSATVVPTTVTAGVPLTYTNITVVKADYDPKTGVGDTFDLVSWIGVGVTTYQLSALNGALVSTQSGGAIY